jgi:hypothetical protein
MNENMRKLTQKIFRRLVTPERTRAIVELADLHQLADHTEVGRILDTLVGARLLVVQTRGDAGGGSVEIVHESLIDRWPTMRRWLDEDQEDAAFLAQLAQAAKQWEGKGRTAGLLWRGDTMEEARRWYNARQRDVPPREKAFLEAVFSLAKRGKRLRRFALITSFVVLGGVAAGASVMLVKISVAEKEATEQAALAKSREKTTADALEGMKKKEAERLEAAKKQKEAEDLKKAAEDANAGIEAAKRKAVAEAEKAEVEKIAAQGKVAETNEQLQVKVRELQANKLKMEATNKDLEKTKKDLQAANERQKAEIERLNKEQS